MPSVTTRRWSVADTDVLGAIVQAGFDSYAEFAPAGWNPPDIAAEHDWRAEMFADPATWTMIAVADGVPVGHVAFFPARERPTGASRGDFKALRVIPGLAHLWQLFVLPDWWGCGVAPLLHDAALAQMRVEGYNHARLFTPSLQSRARRFYERRGWSAEGKRWSEEFALEMTEYRLILD